MTNCRRRRLYAVFLGIVEIWGTHKNGFVFLLCGWVKVSLWALFFSFLVEELLFSGIALMDLYRGVNSDFLSDKEGYFGFAIFGA